MHAFREYAFRSLNACIQRADQGVWRWFGHVRVDSYRMARRVLIVNVIGWRVRGRSSLGWMYGEKMALSNRGMTVEAAGQCVKDRKEWGALGSDVGNFLRQRM